MKKSTASEVEPALIHRDFLANKKHTMSNGGVSIS